MAELIVKLLNTHVDNEALNPENSQDSDNTYAIFDKTRDPLYRVQGSHDGSNLGVITKMEAFVEYYTVDIIDDFCYCTFYLSGPGESYAISLRRLYARPVESIQYEERYGELPPWSFFAEPTLIGKVVTYMKIKGPDKGTFYIDQIGWRITYTPAVPSEVEDLRRTVDDGVVRKLVDDGVITKNVYDL